MNALLYFLLLFVGLVCLWKSGELSVRYAIGVSVIYKVEKFMIGFLIFAISTGLPEISSAIVSSIKKVPELSASDLMGSSFVNMSLILGIVLLLTKKIEIDSFLKKKIYQTIGLIVLILIGISFSPQENILTGILLIIVYFGSVFWFQAGIPKKAVSKEIEAVEEKVEKIAKKAKFHPKVDILLKLFGSLVFLMLSSWLMIHSSVQIAKILHINLTLIGGLLIAVGTSFPELSLEIHAIRQKEYDLAFGDIFGSSLLNVSFIMGLLTLFNPALSLTFARQVLPFILAITVWIVQKFIRKKPFIRPDGYFFLGIFALYVVWMVLKVK